MERLDGEVPAALPTVDLGAFEEPAADLRVCAEDVQALTGLVVPTAPCSLLMRTADDHIKYGFLLVLNGSRADLATVALMEAQATFDQKERVGAFDGLPAQRQAELLVIRTLAQYLQSMPAAANKPVPRESIMQMALLKEYTRRFVLNRKAHPSDPRTDAQRAIQYFAIAHAEKDPATGVWRVADRGAVPLTLAMIECEASAAAGNRKHCMNGTAPKTVPGPVPGTVGTYCPRACVPAGCAQVHGGCMATGFKRLWCHRCDISCYCSIECKNEDKAAHRAICRTIQTQRRQIGMDRVCHECGVPDYTLSQRLQLCGGCKQARFCSKECAKRAWKNGHKMECAALAKELQEQGGAIAPS